jgi:hypothetical protein
MRVENKHFPQGWRFTDFKEGEHTLDHQKNHPPENAHFE